MIEALSSPRNRAVAVALLTAIAATAGAQEAGDVDWPVYLGAGSSQYSGLTDITRDNVGRLEVAWTYRAGDADTETNRTQMQTSPIVVEGVLYGVSPVTKVFALDAATGGAALGVRPVRARRDGAAGAARAAG